MKVSFNNQSNSSGGKSRSFSFKKKEWPDDENKQKFKMNNPQGGVAFSESLRVLQGDEHPELFLQWLSEYQTKIWNNSQLNMEGRKDILLRLVEGEANSIILRTIRQCTGSKSADGTPIVNTYIFKHHPIRLKIAQYDDNQWKDYVTKGAHERDIIIECVHALKLELFGQDSAGRSSYTHLKRQMRNMKVDFTHGIRKWATRMEEFQGYLCNTLWEAGAARGQSLTQFNEMEMREILGGAIQKAHINQLVNIDWDVEEMDYNETIAKLETLEPHIIQSFNNEKRLSALEGEQPTKRGIKIKKEPKTGTNHGERKKDWTPCKTCGKYHKGTCRFAKDGGTPDKPDDKRKRKWTKEIVTVVQQVLAQRGERNASSSDSSDNEGSWKRHAKNKMERVYVLGAAQADQQCSDSDISIDSATAKRYLKTYRSQSKKKRRKAKR